MHIHWKDLQQTEHQKSRRCWPRICQSCSRMRVVTLLIAVMVLLLLMLYQVYVSGPTGRSISKCIGCQEFSENHNISDALYRRQRVRVKGTSRYLPQCIIIGARKAGTRALIQILNVHPKIMTAGQEVHFFDDDDKYDKGLEWYKKQMPFSFSNQITIEKTPAYFIADDAPGRVAKMNSSIKLLLIIRDPVERAISDYTQLRDKAYKNGYGYKSFEEMVYNFATMEVNKDSQIIHRSIYYRHMQKWLDFFSLEQFLIVHGEKLVTDPVPEIAKVETFLGLQHQIGPENFVYNSTRGFYCFRNVSLGQAAKCLSETKGRQHPDVDPDVVQELRKYFAPFNQKFYKLVNRDFGWPEPRAEV